MINYEASISWVGMGTENLQKLNWAMWLLAGGEHAMVPLRPAVSQELNWGHVCHQKRAVA